MKHLRTLGALLTCLIAGLFQPGMVFAQAAPAAVSLNGPSEATVGQTFQVTAAISGAKDIDTIRLNGTFTAGLVELQTMYPVALKSISPGNFTNQTTGVFSLGSFSVSDRINGRASLATFVFKAKKTGLATIALGGDSLILSNGVDQTSRFGSIKVMIREQGQAQRQQEYLLSLTSPTHPEGIGWRSQRKVEALIDVSKAKRGYIGFDRSPDGPADKDVTKSEYTFTADADGVWYIHGGAVFADGTFVKKALMVLIDTEPPRPLEPSVDQTEVPADVPNTLRFATLDDTSGIDRYEVRLSNGYVTTTQETALDLMVLELRPDQYLAQVIAYDRAGNSVSGEVRFRIVEPFLPEAPSEATPSSFDLVDWLYAIGIATLVLALIFFYLGYHRRRRRRHQQSMEEV
jgi:hypothetical protein